MNYKVIINPELGGNDFGNSFNGEYDKDYILKFSQLLSNKLNNINISNYMVRTNDKTLTTDDRVNIIKTINNNNMGKPLVLTIGLENDLIEIIYSLRSKNNLAKKFNDEFIENGFEVGKYYQKRDSVNTNLDYDAIINKLPENESIIIKLGSLSNNEYLNKDIDILSDSVVEVIKDYVGFISTENNYYTVQKGDSLYALSKKFNISINKIKEDNKLINDNIYVGQKLLINDSNIYTVQNGDTLYMIARKNGITVNELKDVNGLKNNTLYIGQKLNIPKNNNKKHIVKKGDNLYNISKIYNVNLNDLIKKNNLKNTTLSIGQILIIP